MWLPVSCGMVADCSFCSYIAFMRAVGIREVKNRLSEFLRLVREGESVLITDHGKVVAQILPPPAYLGAAQESEQEALARLARTGRLRPGAGTPVSAQAPPLPPPATPVDLEMILAETRHDRDGA
jgi:prevent-host-death family protein